MSSQLSLPRDDLELAATLHVLDAPTLCRRTQRYVETAAAPSLILTVMVCVPFCHDVSVIGPTCR